MYAPLTPSSIFSDSFRVSSKLFTWWKWISFNKTYKGRGRGADVPLLKTNAGTRPKRELQHRILDWCLILWCLLRNCEEKEVPPILFAISRSIIPTLKTFATNLFFSSQNYLTLAALNSEHCIGWIVKYLSNDGLKWFKNV